MNNVTIFGKQIFQNKNGKTMYVLHCVRNDSEREGLEGAEVLRAFTTKAHFDVMKVGDIKDGYLNFNNGFTNFYLPKSEVK